MDYYKTLGVNRNASQSDIKSAFKKQAMKHHPDKGGDPKQFQQLNEAYEVLGNAQKKSQYDMICSANPQHGRPGARTWEFRSDSFPDDIGDVFNQFFGGGRSPFGQRQPFRKNRDIIIQTEISLEDVLTGKEIQPDGFLDFYSDVVSVIPEGDDYEFFGWNKPVFNKISTSRALTFSWLTPNKKYDLNVDAFLASDEGDSPRLFNFIKKDSMWSLSAVCKS